MPLHPPADADVPPGTPRPRVALFVTCLTETFYPRAAIACTLVLEHLGCSVDFPSAQTCCGQPMHNNGLRDEAAALARRMIEVFGDATHVVTPSGSCAAMVHHFPEVLAGDPLWRERASAMASKTFEFNQFLLDVLRVDTASLGGHWDGDVTYHPACHLRTIGMHARADAPLRGVEGVRILPLENAEQCCGFGGLFALKQPALSGALARDKAAAVAKTGADTLVCNDAGCCMNIEGACRRAGTSVHIRTSAEIIAESLGLLPRAEGEHA